MPTYEFRCPDGHDFEKFYRTISGAESQSACPACGKPAERIMSTAGFSFKGSGFYLTDYGKNAHREKGSGETKPASDSSSKDAGGGSDAPAKTDAAPAASSESAKPEKTAESKPAESKPAAPPKPSSE